MGCPVTVSCGSPPDGDVGTPYTHTFPTTGGPNLFFSITAGALPPGLTLDPATGIVSGTPTTAGSYSFTVTVIDAQILVAGDDGSFSDSKIALSSDDGSTWSKVTTAITDSGYSVFYSAALQLWIEGTDGAGTTEQVQTSPDGVDGNWTAQSSPADGSGSVRRIVAGKDKVVALFFKAGTMHIMTTTDGSSWTEQTLPSTITNISSSADVCYSPDLDLYVIAEVTPTTNIPGNTGGVLTSPDGITWTLQYKASNMGSSGVAWGNGTFVIIGNIQGSGEHLYTSPDGFIWTRHLADPGGSPIGWNDIWFANGVFVIVSSDTTTNPGNQAAYSTDGISWTLAATPGTGKHWAAVSFGYGTWIAGNSGFGSTTPLMKSTDNGATWSIITLGFSYGFINGVAFGPLDNCDDSADCSINITGATMGNVWSGGAQGSGNHW